MQKNFSTLKCNIKAYFDLKWECFFLSIFLDKAGKKQPIFLGQRWKEIYTAPKAIRKVSDHKIINKVNAIGIKTGSATNLLVLDLDVNKNKNGMHKIKKMGIKIPKNTISVQTPSGGIHYYFSFPEELEQHSTGSNLFEKNSGIDLRGNGGFVIAPPTTINNYGKYQWLVSPFIPDLNPMPDKLLNLIIDNYKKRESMHIESAGINRINIGKISEKQMNVYNDLLLECSTTKKGSRSENDFKLISWGIKIGMSKNELWNSCKDISKFKEKGYRYFETTYNNAFK